MKHGLRGAYFSQPIFRPDRSLCSHHLRQGMPNVRTIGELSMKMARPAGFEPATPGLEGRAFPIWRNNADQRGPTRNNGAVFQVVFRSFPERSLDSVTEPPLRRPDARGGGRTWAAWMRRGATAPSSRETAPARAEGGGRRCRGRPPAPPVALCVALGAGVAGSAAAAGSRAVGRPWAGRRVGRVPGD